MKVIADECADGFENYDPEPSDQNAPLSPLMAVTLAAEHITD